MERDRDIGYEKYRNRIDHLCKEGLDKDLIQICSANGTISGYSYRDLRSLFDRFEEILKRYNLQPGDRVAIIGKKQVNVVLAFLTASYFNLTSVLIDAELSQMQMSELIRTGDPQLIIAENCIYDLLRDNIDHGITVLDFDGLRGTFVRLQRTANDLKRSIDRDKDTAAIVFSAGTTGMMKPVEITYEGIWNTCEHILEIIGKKDRKLEYLSVFPPYHFSGLASSLAAVLNGGVLEMAEVFSPSILPKLFKAFNPMAFAMIPKVLDIIVDGLEKSVSEKSVFTKAYYRLAGSISMFCRSFFHCRKIGYILMKPFSRELFGNQIEIVCSGSSECRTGTVASLLNMGLVFGNIYASTECGVITSTGCMDAYEADSVGKVTRCDGIRVTIHEPDKDGIGEIYVQSDELMKGYFGNPQLTAASFDGPWFRTGDLGMIDDRMYLHLKGRCKESIHLPSGKKIGPEELERLLEPLCPEDVPYVCAVPDSKGRFDEIHVFFENKGRSPQETEAIRQKLLISARMQLPLYPVSGVHFQDSIPRNNIQKVQRSLLKETVLKERLDHADATFTPSDDIEEWLLSEIQSIVHSDIVFGPDCTLFSEIGLDSLGLCELIIQIENKWGIDLSDTISPGTTLSELSEQIHGLCGDKRQKGRKQKKNYLDLMMHPGSEKPLMPKCLLYDAGRVVLGPALTLIYRPKVLYENADASRHIRGGVLIMSNHHSYYDILQLVTIFLDRRIRFESQRRFFEKWGVRWLFSKTLVIPVNKGAIDKETVQETVNSLKNGWAVCIFGEGTINRNSELTEIKRGVVSFSVQSERPIVPVYLLKRESVFDRLVCAVGEPVEPWKIIPQNYAGDRDEYCTDYLFQKEKELEKLCKEYQSGK